MMIQLYLNGKVNICGVTFVPLRYCYVSVFLKDVVPYQLELKGGYRKPLFFLLDIIYSGKIGEMGNGPQNCPIGFLDLKMLNHIFGDRGKCIMNY